MAWQLHAVSYPWLRNNKKDAKTRQKENNMKTKNKSQISKRGDTWVGRRPAIFIDRKGEKNKKQCRHWRQQRNKVTDW